MANHPSLAHSHGTGLGLGLVGLAGNLALWLISEFWVKVPHFVLYVGSGIASAALLAGVFLLLRPKRAVIAPVNEHQQVSHGPGALNVQIEHSTIGTVLGSPAPPSPTVNLSFVGPRTDHEVPMIQRTYYPPTGGATYGGGTVTSTSLASALTATGPVGPDAGGYETETRYASFAFARVVNNQSDPGGLAAEDARCYVTFYSEGKAWLFPEIKARWRDADSPLSLSPYQLHTAAEAIRIPADSEPRELDVAMKYPEDAYCYAYNNANTSGYEWSRKPEHRLTELEFIAEVTVRGSNFPPLTRRFLVSHGGIGTVLAIQELES